MSMEHSQILKCEKIIQTFLHEEYLQCVDSRDDDMSEEAIAEWWTESFLDEVNQIYFHHSTSTDNFWREVSMEELIEVIKYINQYYESNFGKESEMDWKKLSPEYLMDHYSYVFIHSNSEYFKNMFEEEFKKLEHFKNMFD